ncbi:MAG: hypothetical protein C4567_05115 [Deltaproteobacteria bacterium]|nr:MAG: hypothetical protein C4567_05115 [Deltaproteobacteria bacterium]
MRAKKALKVLVAVALILALATPAMADWQSLGWAFFGLAAFNTAVATAALARPRVYVSPQPVYAAPPPGYYSPPPAANYPPAATYPSGYFYRPAPYGYFSR